VKMEMETTNQDTFATTTSKDELDLL